MKAAGPDRNGEGTWNAKQRWQDVPIPVQLAARPRDARGYPIPANVWHDTAGTPHFTINDHTKALGFILHKQCPICGGKLDPTMFFLGGPRSAFDPRGVYIDQPMHEDCAKYALKVCPYLGAPNYSKRIDARKVDPANTPAHVLFQDNTMLPDRPTAFVLVEVSDYAVTAQKDPLFYLRPKRPYVSVEFWRAGVQLTYAEAVQAIPGLAELAKGQALKGLA